MPGNRAIFDRALEDSRIAGERGAWPDALRAAIRAAQEFPDDTDARSAVAVGFYHTQKYTEAAQLLEDLRKRRGSDPFTLSYLARAYEGAQIPEKAVEVLAELGEQSLREGRPADAQEAFEEAVRLSPAADEQMRVRLAEFFVESGQPQRAAEQCVAIALTRYTTGNWDGTAEALDEALGLDPGNQEAKALQIELRNAREPREPVRVGPVVEINRQKGTGSLNQGLMIDQLVSRAGQERASGQATAALRSYEEAIALGADRPDIYYGYGVLLQEHGDHQRAVGMLRRASVSEEYAISAQYALGESLRTLGQTREAAEAFENTLRLVDLSTIGRGEADDLIVMYQAAAECYIELGELSRAASLYGTIATVFQNKRWGRELAEQFRTRATELTERSMVAKLRIMGTGALPVERAQPREPEPEPEPAPSQVWGSVPSFTDFLRPEVAASIGAAVASSQPIDPFAALNLPEVSTTIFAPLTPLPTENAAEMTVRYVATSGRFTDQGLLHAAIDACHEIIRTDPEYLPIHLRLGEIYEREGKVEQALLKYRALIDTYAARERPLEAVDAYYRFVELSPDTVNSRSQLADLLRRAGRTAEAVDQSLMVANTLFKIGQTNRALEEFRRLLAWAPPSAATHKEYGLALLKLERWEAAQDEFRRAVQCDPDDLVALAQVNLTLAILGTNERALWESMATLLEKLKQDSRYTTAVQSEYRTALMIVDVPLLHYLLGLQQQISDQHSAALLTFQQALNLLESEGTPQFPPVLAHQALAESYIAQGQAREAIQELETALQMLEEQPQQAGNVSLPTFARPLPESELQRRLATALVTADNPDGAVKALRRCIALDPGDVSAYTQLAAVYFLQGKLQLALEQLDHVATFYEERQQLDQAIETLEQAVKLAPNTITVRSRLAHLLIRRGVLDRGLRELNEVAQLQKSAGRTRDAVASMQHAAEAYWMLGKHPEAFKLYNAIVTLVPEDAELRHQLVNLYLMAGQNDQAIAEMRRMAQTFVRAGNVNEAITALHQLTGLAPDGADAYAELAGLLAETGQHDQALRTYERLQRLRPNDAEVAVRIKQMAALLSGQGTSNQAAPSVEAASAPPSGESSES